MAVKFEKLVKDTADTMKKAGKKKTSEYDTNGIVKRVDGKTAWVHFDGGVDETPVRMTISAKAGDKVRVHVGGGKAYITGNETAPPTDDREAKKASQYAGEARKAADDADEKANKAQKTANDAMSATDALGDDLESLAGDVDDISDLVGDGDDSGIVVKTQYYLSTSNTTQQGGQWVDSLPTYVSGRYYWTRTVTIYADGSEVEGTAKLDVTNQIAAEVNAVATATDQHFWHDSTGAYVTRSNKNVGSDYAMKFTNQGILQTYNGKNLMALTGSGLSYYQSDGSTPMAVYSSGGATIYGGSTSSYTTFDSDGMKVYKNGLVASFGSTATIGSTSGYYISINPSNGFSVSNVLRVFAYSGSARIGFTSLKMFASGSSEDAPTIDIRSSGTYVGGSLSSSGNISTNGSVNGSSLSITSGGTIKGGATINGGATITGGLDVTGDTTVKKLYVGTPGTAESNTANCRIATGENNRIMFTGSSSREIKHAIKPVTDNFLDPHKLYDAEVVQFIYNLDYLNKNDARYDMPVVGFIAEDLYKVYPVAVDIEHGKPHDWNERFIIPPMLALIQEQKKEIDHLTERVKILEERSVA